VLCLTFGLGVDSANAKPPATSKATARSTPAETLRPELPKPSIQPAKAAKPGQKPTRRAQRHSEAASKRDRITELARIRITGRQMRPQAVIEIPKQEHHFKSGTTQYSPRDKQYTRGKK